MSLPDSIASTVIALPGMPVARIELRQDIAGRYVVLRNAQSLVSYDQYRMALDVYRTEVDALLDPAL